MRKLSTLFLGSALLLATQPAMAAENPASYRMRTPSLQQTEFNQDDTAIETVFGREIAARILSQYAYRRDASLQRYLNLVGQTIVLQLNRPELDFHFAAIDSDEINAYSTPGGYVFISTAALKLMDNEAELAAVLSHELGHINERHIVRELNLKATDSGVMNSIASMLGGASETANVAFSQTVNKAVDILFRDGYSRDDEIEADRDAVFYCALSGYDPRGLLTYLKKVAATKGKITVGKSYPLYEQRFELLETQIRDENLTEGTLYSGESRLIAAMASIKRNK